MDFYLWVRNESHILFKGERKGDDLEKDKKSERLAERLGFSSDELYERLANHSRKVLKISNKVYSAVLDYFEQERQVSANKGLKQVISVSDSFAHNCGFSYDADPIMQFTLAWWCQDQPTLIRLGQEVCSRAQPQRMIIRFSTHS